MRKRDFKGMVFLSAKTQGVKRVVLGSASVSAVGSYRMRGVGVSTMLAHSVATVVLQQVWNPLVYG